MKAREKAQWIIDHYRHIGPEDSQKIVGNIEKAIIAAEEKARAEEAKISLVEIDRAVAVAIEATIEECAMALDNHRPVSVFVIMGYDITEDEEGNEQTNTICMPASNLIRALAAPKEKEIER